MAFFPSIEKTRFLAISRNSNNKSIDYLNEFPMPEKDLSNFIFSLLLCVACHSWMASRETRKISQNKCKSRQSYNRDRSCQQYRSWWDQDGKKWQLPTGIYFHCLFFSLIDFFFSNIESLLAIVERERAVHSFHFVDLSSGKLAISRQQARRSTRKCF